MASGLAGVSTSDLASADGATLMAMFIGGISMPGIFVIVSSAPESFGIRVSENDNLMVAGAGSLALLTVGAGVAFGIGAF